MQELLRQALEQVKELWDRLSSGQRIAILSVAILSIAALVLMVVWVRNPDYSLLFSNLAPKDAGKIVEGLKEIKAPYRLEKDGTAIYVPSDKVYELRLELASQGLPKISSVGYEIFDKTNLGMSDFVQKLNYKRALEGELTRTIQQIEAVQQSRVHIVIPEPALFEEDEEEATASIVLTLSSSKRLPRSQVEGITHLVASSVEGLEPDNVTVVDSRGNILSSNRTSDPIFGMTANQMETQRGVEQYLAKKAQSLLDRVLGAGNSIVRINSELNLDRIESTIETFDPENAVVRSEERLQDTHQTIPSSEQAGEVATQRQGGTSTSSENILTNYEINSTVEHIVNSVGNLKRLSVAVTVNGTYEEVQVEENGETVTQSQYVARSDEELNKIADIVGRTVGLDMSRGDQIQVSDMPFDMSLMDQERSMLEEARKTRFWTSIAKYGGIALLAIMFLFLLRSLLKDVAARYAAAPKPALEAAAERITAALPGMEEETLPQLELQALSKLQEQLSNLIQEKPSEAAQLIRTWLVDVGEPTQQE